MCNFVTNEDQLKRQLRKPTLASYTNYGQNVGIAMHTKKSWWANNPIYIGYSILWLAKLSMSRFIYHHLLPSFVRTDLHIRTNTIYTDTDSVYLESQFKHGQTNLLAYYEALRSMADILDTSCYERTTIFLP